MSGKNLPGGLIQVKDNGDGTLCYVFDKFCIFEKGYINSIYNPLTTLSKPSSTVPVFNYGLTGGILFDFVDNKGNSITVNQAPVTGNYALTFPAINSNDTLVTTGLAQTLTNKTIENPTFNVENSGYGIFTIVDNNGNSISAIQQNPLATGIVNLSFPAIPGSDTICLLALSQTLLNKTLNAPVFSGISSGLIQNSSQYIFSAYSSTSQNNVTGTGTAVKVIYDTLEYQTGSGYDTSTATFTAPIAGKYKFNCGVYSDWGSTGNIANVTFITSVRNYGVVDKNPTPDINGVEIYHGTYIINMALNETIYVAFMASGLSTNGVDVTGAGLGGGTYFQGELLIAA